MGNLIEKSGSGRIVVPDMLYQSPERLLVVDTGSVSAHLDVASEFAGEDAAELEQTVMLLGEREKQETDAGILKIIRQAIKRTSEQAQDAREEEKVFYNLSRLLRSEGKKNGAGMVTIPCPPALAEMLWKARPSMGDPATYRDYPGWWNFDLYRLDDYIPPA